MRLMRSHWSLYEAGGEWPLYRRETRWWRVSMEAGRCMEGTSYIHTSLTRPVRYGDMESMTAQCMEIVWPSWEIRERSVRWFEVWREE